MDAPTVITTGIVTSHPALTISPAGTTHTTPWADADSTPAAPSKQHKILSPGRYRNSQELNPHKPHHPKTVTIQDSFSDS